MTFSYLKCTVLLALVCAVAVHDAWADGEQQEAATSSKDAVKNLGGWFVSHYKKVEDFFADSVEDLKKKVNDTGNFLNDCKPNLMQLRDYAINKSDTGLHTALYKVGEFATRLKTFNNSIGDLASKTDADIKIKTDDWKKQMKDMYNGGLDKIIKAVQDAKSGATMQKCSLVFTIVLIAVIAATAV